MGTEYSLSPTERGSKPAINAEVSRTITLFVRRFHPERREAYLSGDDKSLL